jgi:enoyl-CoA hydratase/carnithine racemase
MLLTGDSVDGEQAYALGLVSELTESGDALGTALELAGVIAGHPQLAVRAIVEAVDAGMDVPLETALLLERKLFQLLFDSEDQREGMNAFLEKRRPEYRGR